RISDGGVPSKMMKLCTASAGALRGEPLSITTTERRERARISAPFSPAAPPPITTASTVRSASASLAYGGVATAMAPCLSLSVTVRSTRRVRGGWRGVLPCPPGSGRLCTEQSETYHG